YSFRRMEKASTSSSSGRMSSCTRAKPRGAPAFSMVFIRGLAAQSPSHSTAHRFHTSLHLFGRHIFLVRHDAPTLSERIEHRPGAITVELVGQRLEDRCSSVHGTL